MALTKAEMSEHLFEKLGLSKRDAKDRWNCSLKRSVGPLRMANR